MFAAAGDDPAYIREVVVANRSSANAFIDLSPEAKWFAFFTQKDAPRFGRMARGYVFVEGQTPADVADDLIDVLRRDANAAAENARQEEQKARDDAAAFDRVASLSKEAP